MGLPHVLVRFYTNPDGRAARRTTLVVLAPARRSSTCFRRSTARSAGSTSRRCPPAPARTPCLLLPAADRAGPARRGPAPALLAAGAFAAFLSTASGLTIVGRRRDRPGRPGPHHRPSRGRRRSAHPRLPARRRGRGRRPVRRRAGRRSTPSLADTVGLAFAVAASTFCPLLVLGIWWRGLTVAGATAGLVTGGVLALRRRRSPSSAGRARSAAAGPARCSRSPPPGPSPRPSSSPSSCRMRRRARCRSAPRGPWSGCTPPRTYEPRTRRREPTDAVRRPFGARGTTVRRADRLRWATARPTRRASSAPWSAQGRRWPEPRVAPRARVPATPEVSP